MIPSNKILTAVRQYRLFRSSEESGGKAAPEAIEASDRLFVLFAGRSLFPRRLPCFFLIERGGLASDTLPGLPHTSL